MTDWIKRLFGKPTVRRVTLYSGLTLKDWQSSETRTKWARQMFHDPMFRDMLEVLRNESPKSAGMLTESNALVQLGVVNGYQACLDIFHALPLSAPVSAEFIEPDYGAADKEEAES